jgi:hypothetical protein
VPYCGLVNDDVARAVAGGGFCRLVRHGNQLRHLTQFAPCAIDLLRRATPGCRKARARDEGKQDSAGRFYRGRAAQTSRLGTCDCPSRLTWIANSKARTTRPGSASATTTNTKAISATMITPVRFQTGELLAVRRWAVCDPRHILMPILAADSTTTPRAPGNRSAHHDGCSTRVASSNFRPPGLYSSQPAIGGCPPMLSGNVGFWTSSGNAEEGCLRNPRAGPP